MNGAIVQDTGPVLLVGGGDVDNIQLAELLTTVNAVVAVDGGADALLGCGVMPDALIGDLDSVSEKARAAVSPARTHHILEQDSTDFDKALRHVCAPLVIGAGFLGARLDHQLAVLSVLVARADRRIVLAGTTDVVLSAPPRLALDLPLGLRLSLYPLRGVTGRSQGLQWPIDGLRFAPDGRIGTSNRVVGSVTLAFDGPGMLLILPSSALAAVLAGLAAAPDGWPAP